jgi:hypothetical protein
MENFVMIESTYIWCFALCALADWRLTHLLARENGPWDLMVRLRNTLGSGFMGRVMDCFYCLSFLVSLPPALWLSRSLLGFLVQWMALSAVTCLLERATRGTATNLRLSPVSKSYLDKVIRGV